MKYEMYKDAKSEWRWRFKSRNGETIAMSSEGYTYKFDCQKSIDLIKASSTAPVVEL